MIVVVARNHWLRHERSLDHIKRVAEKIIEELKDWFNDNINLLAEYKFTLKGGFHTDLVKSN